MKKDRNCGMPYPIYPAYPGMISNPGMMQGVPMNPVMQQPYTGQTGSSIEQQLNSLNNQINSLERRVSSLESLVGSSNSKYNNTNYQVM